MANEKLTWIDLRKSIAQMAGTGEQVTGLFMDALIDAIIEGLQKDGQVKIKGIGTFALKPMAARKSVNIATGEEFVIQGYNKLTFTPEATLKENVEKRIETPTSSLVVEELTKDPLKKLGEQANEIVDILADLGQAPVAVGVGVGAALASAETAAAEEVIEHLTEEVVETATEQPIVDTIEESHEEVAEESISQPTEQETIQPTHDPIEEKEEITDDIMEEIEEVIEEPKPTPVQKKTVTPTKIETAEEEEEEVSKKKRVGSRIFAWTFILILIGSAYWGYTQYQELMHVPEEETTQPSTKDKQKPKPFVVVETLVEGRDGKEVRIDTIAPVAPTPAPTYEEVKKVSIAEKPRVYTKFEKPEIVKRGSRLTQIAQKRYGDIKFWVYIYEANRDQIKTPSSIEIGQELKIPSMDAEYLDLCNPELQKLLDELIKKYDKR
jgi:nucleoid DNA-binding protein